jgi:4-amino-4-deoxy-L-arabinose transferase-like glycosyltransferase
VTAVAVDLAPRSRAVPALALLLLAVHMVYAGRYGIFRDEMYYVACGKHLAFGYVDHPPLVAILARIATFAFGDSVGSVSSRHSARRGRSS